MRGGVPSASGWRSTLTSRPVADRNTRHGASATSSTACAFAPVRALDGAAEVSLEAFARALQAGANAVVSLGGAELGDKTMVDALLPAVASLVESLRDGKDFIASTTDAADTAESAADETATLVARKGRASYTGSGGLGHVDPGAKGIALIFAALAATAVSVPAPERAL